MPPQPPIPFRQPRRKGGPLPDLPELTPQKTVVDGTVVEVTVPPLVEPVTRGSLADIPFLNAAEAPDHAVIARKSESGGWYDVTSHTFAEEVLAVAKGLIAHGLEPGDRLAIMSRTTYEWTLLDFAAWAAGLVTVPIYPTSSASQARFILQDAGIRACVVQTPEQQRLINGERGNVPSLIHLWQVETGAIRQLTDAGREIHNGEVARRRAALTPHIPATIIYTSGTSGEPKGCVLTHGNFLAEVDNDVAMLHPLFTDLEEDGPASTLLFLPLSHVFGRMGQIACLRARVKLAHAPSTRTRDLLADLASFRPSFLLGIPYLLEKVFASGRAAAEKIGKGASFDRAARIAHRYGEAVGSASRGGSGPGTGLKLARSIYDRLVYQRIRAALGGRCHYVICGGSPLGERLSAFFEGAGVSIVEGYGLTESAAATTCTPVTKPRLGTVGWPVPGTTVRIAEDGEILLKGAHIFTGYWDRDREVAVPQRDEDGWFATGDLGALDDDGYLRITGRKKDVLILTSGKNVIPGPLEDWLRVHPLVSQCLVIGDNRPYAAALITLERAGLKHWRKLHGKDDPDLTAEDLVHDPDLLRNLQRAVDEANKLVSRSEAIRRFLVLPHDFTEEDGHLTPSLQLRREAIVADFAKEIDELYA